MTSSPGNIFILSSDSLRYDHFSRCFDEVVDELDPVVFENAVSTASNTNSSLPALSTGVYAEAIEDVGLPADGPPVPIAEVLSEAGYSCGLWTGNQLFGESYNYDRGFTGGDVGSVTTVRRIADILSGHDLLFNVAEWVYFNVISPGIERAGGDSNVWRSAETLHDGALSWLDDQDKGDAFCWLHYMDNHHPYMPPNEYLEKAEFNHEWTRTELGEFSREAVYSDGKGCSETELEDIHTAYEATCEYLADEVQEFIRTLKQRDQFRPDRDTLVITADHGESFLPNQHGEMGHSNLWEEVVRVPLVVSHPDWEAGRIEGQVSLIDLMPTLLNITDHSIPDSVQGTGYNLPSELVREEAYFSNAQPWYNIQRGIRTSNGEKMFGISDGVDTYGEVFSRYESGSKATEDIVVSQYYGGDNFSRDCSNYNNLVEKLQDVRGPPVEEVGEFEIEEDLQSHLKQLGYLE